MGGQRIPVHQLVGDLTYLAPEQTQPGTLEDARCDIYRLGATLYSLLAGRPRLELGLVAGAAPGKHVLDTLTVTRPPGQFAGLAEDLGRWRGEGFTVRKVR